ncbi:histone deacetylase 11 [Dermatophagoides pteronyssinus]|uniref:histone deacetylase 11 n=1 Tax=Dermatophagoides pteronyssinus TaxID=6956 RepID=UPI003F66FB9A
MENNDSSGKDSTFIEDIILIDKSNSTNYPIIFRPEYDIKIGCFIEHLHPFDTSKWGKVAKFIQESFDSNINYMEPEQPISNEQLRLVHSEQFIRNIRSRRNLVRTSENFIFYFLPFDRIDQRIIQPLRYQTSGTIMAACWSYKHHSSSINLGGGFHHCTANRSAGFCFFADITLAIRNIWSACVIDNRPPIPILIVDCDAHQGNGYERDVLRMTKDEKKLIYILDMFNPRIYPRDEFARKAINREIHVSYRTNDENYIKLLDFHLNAIIETDHFQPSLIIYNAGTDCLQGDRLGQLKITPEGIMKRDETMFRFGLNNKVAIVMLLSGGYQRNNARIIADSIVNLIESNLLKPL